MKKIISFFVFVLLGAMLCGQSKNVRMVVTVDDEVRFFRGQTELRVRGYTGEPTYKADYYIATNGNDSNDGTTIATPWRTFTHAAGVLDAGDTLMVRAGTYFQDFTVFVNNGSAGNPIVIMNYPGEAPVIDGNGIELGGGAIVMVYSDYFHLEGMKVKGADASGAAIIVAGQNCQIRYCTVYDCLGSGIGVGGDDPGDGDDTIVEYCHVYDVYLDNEGGGEPSWGTGLSARRSPDSVIIRHNIVHDVWGEGISTYEATNTIIEDNIVYDCLSVLLYVSDATDCLVQRNLVYQTGYMPDDGGVGIGHWVEGQMPVNARNTFLNNIVYGCERNFRGFTMDNVTVYNNTFVNANWGMCVQIDGHVSETSIFKNNIIIQEDGLPCIDVSGTPGNIDFGYNLYNKAYDEDAEGVGDVIGDPLFTKTGSILPGVLTGHYFDLQALSPAIDAALDVDLADDYFGNARGNDPDIGAIEKQ